MSEHWRYKFSVTIHSDSLAMVSAFRGLAQHCQEDRVKAIAWGGTKEPDWIRDSHKVTFHFSELRYRENFVRLAKEGFSPTIWTLVGTSDNDPATPQT